VKLHRLQPPAARLGRTVWPGLRRALPIAAALFIGAAAPTFGQAGLGQLAVRSDGFIFWIENGVRHVVYPVSLSDEQINALPEGIPLNASLQPDLGPTAPLVVPDGTSRASRLRLGQPCLCSLVRGTGEQSDFQITVTGVQRDAWESLRSTSPTNQQPRAGAEIVLVDLDIRYLRGPSDLPVSLDRFDYSLIDSNNALARPAFVVEPRPIVSQTVFPGAVVSGQVAFQIPRGDPDPVLVWSYNKPNTRWLGLQ
jgi:hypothetical protein